MAFTIDKLVDFARVRAGDVDPAAYRYTLEEWIAALEHARMLLAVRLVPTFALMVIDETPFAQSITPTPSDEEGVLLALMAAKGILDLAYAAGLDAGSLGTSWQSGLESESTISAEKAYRSGLTLLGSEIEEHTMILRRGTTGARMQ